MSVRRNNVDLYSTECRKPTSCQTVEDAWEKLLADGWTIVADSNTDLGFDPSFREYVNATYFGEDGILDPEQYDVFPPDRKRARGAVGISFNVEGEAALQDVFSAPVINKDRGVDKGERAYRQTELMGDDRFRHWLATLSGLIPPPAEHIPGTILNGYGGFDPNVLFDRHGRLPQSTDSSANVPFYAALTGQLEQGIGNQLLRRLSGGGSFLVGVNLFEVNRDVVSGPHQDNTHWNAVTVIGKHGVGATSQLFDLHAPEPFFEYTLAPGQTLIINDRRFKHSATRLEPTADGISHRRTIVCTFDFAGKTGIWDSNPK